MPEDPQLGIRIFHICIQIEIVVCLIHEAFSQIKVMRSGKGDQVCGELLSLSDPKDVFEQRSAYPSALK